MEYTKGKWEVSMFMTQWTNGHTKIKAWVNSIGIGKIEPHSGKKITNIAHVMCGDTRMESECTARLISNAPQMYETLLKISKYRNTEAGQLAIKAIKELIK